MMNEYRFDDLSIGLKESFEYKITLEAMEKFRGLTGDDNPLHVDDEFAREHGFVGRVTYGMLSASLFSTLGGMYLPGKYCIVQECDTKFLQPVYVGDVLTVTGEVREMHESVQRADIKVTIVNQDNKKVVRGTLKVGFLE